jgi:hypothetical protein
MKQELIDYLIKNGKDLSWSELATKFNLATGEIARHIWRKYKADQQGLQLKSRWQANTKDGIKSGWKVIKQRIMRLITLILQRL